MANCVLSNLAVKVVQTVAVNGKDIFCKELIADLGAVAKFSVFPNVYWAMFEDTLSKGEGKAVVDSRALFFELDPGLLGGLRNMGYTELEQNTGHCG